MILVSKKATPETTLIEDTKFSAPWTIDVAVVGLVASLVVGAPPLGGTPPPKGGTPTQAAFYQGEKPR
jgi:hypothetical protein